MTAFIDHCAASGVQPMDDESTGFVLQLEARPGMPQRHLVQFERDLEDYVDSRGLSLRGHRMRYWISRQDTPASAADQVALLDWLHHHPAIAIARVGPVRPLRDGEDDSSAVMTHAAEEGFVQLHTSDVALLGLAMLYRSGRIGPELYLQVLGGYVRAVVLH